MTLDVSDYLLFLFIIIAFIWDVKYKKLPNLLTFGGMAIALVIHLIFDHLEGFLASSLGLLVGGGVMLILYFFRAVGAGDVKLFAAIGAFTGIQLALYSMMYSIIYAGIIGLIILLCTRQFMIRMMNGLLEVLNSVTSRSFKALEEYKRKESLRFPFMYAVLPAIVTTYYYFI
ncbi:prepilin peptidase CpaA [Pullulanibacillus pueri]|uniref:Prepilin type IV endopeptidase peptidase domain-containing protein n=1 Tax=Pullulanibacillus pueri TaxID=1437324 RepID=A0A8J2ZU77_9BACL|nr:A24 family peptidase [Pullulanibacillus pueri]MBM7681326.1 prepilin peptidase CpaA [Pullulanibacillus pueri]GGH77579.1 hypothetical protein GCM10007096_09680 [Pullulanibacillus pueri]